MSESDKAKIAVELMRRLEVLYREYGRFNWIWENHSEEDLHYKHFKPTDKPPVQTGGVIDEFGNDISQGTHNLPSVMTYLAATSSTVRAVFTPEGVHPTDVVYSANWKNVASEWATGKVITDYFMIEQQSAGSAIATTTCIKAFGEPIEIVVTLASDPTVTGKCTVNYVKLNKFTMNAFGKTVTSGTEVTAMSGTNRAAIDYNDGTPISVMASTSGTGTVTPTASAQKAVVSMSPTFSTEFNKWNAGVTVPTYAELFKASDVDISTYAKLGESSPRPLFASFLFDYSHAASILKTNYFTTGAKQNAFYDVMKQACSSIQNEGYVFAIKATVTYTYTCPAGKVAYDQIAIIYVTFDYTTFPQRATGVTVGGGEIAFGSGGAMV